MKAYRKNPEEVRKILRNARHQYVERQDVARMIKGTLVNEKSSLVNTGLAALVGLASGFALNFVQPVGEFYNYLNSGQFTTNYDFREFLSAAQFDLLVPMGLSLAAGYSAAFWQALQSTRNVVEINFLNEHARRNEKRITP